MYTYIYFHNIFGLSYSIDKILKYCFCINKMARVTVTYQNTGYLNSLLLSCPTIISNPRPSLYNKFVCC